MSRRIMLVALSVISGLGCNQTAPIKETSSQAHAVEPGPRVSVDHSVDSTILDLVLSDLRVYQESDCPLSLSRDVPRDIYFSPTLIDSTPQPKEPLDHNKLWSEMTDSQGQLTQEGIKHIEERHAAGDSFRDFRPTSDAIHVMDAASNIDTTAKDVPYGARFPIQAWAPGYSHDGSCVVVHLYFPEMLHPSYATYVLVSTNGTWMITFRGFITYA